MNAEGEALLREARAALLGLHAIVRGPRPELFAAMDAVKRIDAALSASSPAASGASTPPSSFYIPSPPIRVELAEALEALKGLEACRAEGRPSAREVVEFIFDTLSRQGSTTPAATQKAAAEAGQGWRPFEWKPGKHGPSIYKDGLWIANCGCEADARVITDALNAKEMPDG